MQFSRPLGAVRRFFVDDCKLGIPYFSRYPLQASQADKITYTGSQVPQIGDIIFFDNSTWGHVAVIQSVLDANRVIVQESNTDLKPTPQSPPVSGNVPVHLSTPSRPKHPRPSPKASARLVMGTSGHDR